jgi:hypothetical protein
MDAFGIGTLAELGRVFRRRAPLFGGRSSLKIVDGIVVPCGSFARMVGAF